MLQDPGLSCHGACFRVGRVGRAIPQDKPPPCFSVISLIVTTACLIDVDGRLAMLRFKLIHLSKESFRCSLIDWKLIKLAEVGGNFHLLKLTHWWLSKALFLGVNTVSLRLQPSLQSNKYDIVFSATVFTCPLLFFPHNCLTKWRSALISLLF
jgi:hypothetical protein